VIEAIGQALELGFLGRERTERLEWPRGRIRVGQGGRTNLEWLRAAGARVLPYRAAGNLRAAEVSHDD
jgi:hypothetical protein